MKYPRIPHELDNRRVFTIEDLQNIKLLYSQGHKVGTLARLYNVAHSTMQYVVDPEYNLKRRLAAREANARRRLDPEYVKLERYRNNQYHKRKRAIIPLENAYDKEQTKKFKSLRPEYFKEWNKNNRKKLKLNNKKHV